MKKSVNIWVLLPKKLKEDIESLDLTNINKGKAIKFVAHLLKENSRDNYDSTKFREKPANYFRESYGGRYLYNFLNKLIENNIIQSDDCFSHSNADSTKNKSKGYRINNDYLMNNLEFINTNYITKDYNSLSNINIHLSPISTLYCNKLHRFQEAAQNGLKVNIKLSKQCIELGISILDFLPIPFKLHQNNKNDVIRTTIEKKKFEDMFESLTYNYKAMEAQVAKVVSELSVNSFKKIDADVDGLTFEIYDRITNQKYWGKKVDTIAKCRERGLTLIQDKDNYYIDDLDRYVETKKKNIELSYKSSISALKKGIYSINRNKTNRRLDSVFTSMCKGTFDIIKADNDLIEIDLVNSQYALLANWILNSEFDKTDDILKFCELAIKGGLYEYIVDELGLDKNIETEPKKREEEIKLARDKAKKIMMSIAFSSYRSNSLNKQAFKKLFPNVYTFIYDFNKANKDGFAIELQNRESAIFIDTILPILMNKGFFFMTKHDSLIIRREDSEIITKIVSTVFALLNIKSSIKVDKQLINNEVLDSPIQDQIEKVVEYKQIKKQDENEAIMSQTKFCKYTSTKEEKMKRVSMDLQNIFASL